MSSKRLSPTAHLLRQSRLFSLPPPLPRPANDLLGHVQSNAVSDTASLPHPIQQAIMTTPQGLARGDWGLKRSLPLKSTTNTSTPLFRINAVDTREHITDYDSASDLTLTLRKVHELNMPVTDKHKTVESLSVFEDKIDNTDPDRANRADPSSTRWKFKGPWVAGMTQGDFEAYVSKELKKRKPEFMAFLREHRKQQLGSERRAAARTEGQDVSSVADAELTEQDMADFIKSLRQDYSLSSQMAALIGRFLDLPTLPYVSRSNVVAAYEAAEKPPPTTHPSAGLTYLRSNAFLDNHPLFGPLARHAPAEARILSSPIKGAFVKSHQGKIGVAGLVASPPQDGGRIRAVPASKELDEMYANNAKSAQIDERGTTIGLSTPGGNRIWVEPTKLTVDSRGRAQLTTMNPLRAAVHVKEGNVDVDLRNVGTRTISPVGTVATHRDAFSQPLDRPRSRQPEEDEDDSQSSGVNILRTLEETSQRSRGAPRRY